MQILDNHSTPHVVLQVPTTVMATVDSSVGGKTGVNHPLGKNMIGAFYQPQCVLIDTDTLNTLPDRELASGISEIIKYGLIRDAPLFQWLEDNMDRLLQRDAEVIPYCWQFLGWSVKPLHAQGLLGSIDLDSV